MSDKNYLAKDGKTFGPYDSKSLDALKSSGEFYTYEWVWDGVSPNWEPVPRKMKGPPPMPAQAVPQDDKKPTTSKKSKTLKSYCSIAFDNRTTLSADLSDVHDSGGRLTSLHSTAQAFPKGAMIWLDILDEETDQAGKVKARVEAASCTEGRWIYTVSWSKFPF